MEEIIANDRVNFTFHQYTANTPQDGKDYSEEYPQLLKDIAVETRGETHLEKKSIIVLTLSFFQRHRRD